MNISNLFMHCFCESTLVWNNSKGQLISKGVLMSLISSKKINEGFRLYYYDTSNRLVFVRFLEESEDTKKPFRNYLTFSMKTFLLSTIYIQGVLALCYFWDLEKTALAKNRISKIFILCTH